MVVWDFFVSLSCLVVLQVVGLLPLNLLFACFSGLFGFVLCCVIVWFSGLVLCVWFVIACGGVLRCFLW